MQKRHLLHVFPTSLFHVCLPVSRVDKAYIFSFAGYSLVLGAFLFLSEFLGVSRGCWAPVTYTLPLAHGGLFQHATIRESLVLRIVKTLYLVVSDSVHYILWFGSFRAIPNQLFLCRLHNFTIYKCRQL